MHQSDQNGEISYVDVKMLYDAAYEELSRISVQIINFQDLLTRAESLDQAYRAQLSQKTAYRGGLKNSDRVLSYYL